MKRLGSRALARPLIFQSGLAISLLISGLPGHPVFAEEHGMLFRPGNLLVSRFVYDNNPNNVVAGVTQLPPGCTSSCVTAAYDGTYPFVWNNNGKAVDSSFGITAKIMLDQLTPSGHFENSLEVDGDWHHRFGSHGDRVVGSFSSKSEGALNLSVDGRAVSIMGYLAPLNALDISNSNTPAVVDPTNPDPQQNYRVAATVNQFGHFTYTKTNAFSGDNGRAVILNDRHGANVLYASGNAGNGDNPQPDGIIIGAGAQIMANEHTSLAAQNPSLPSPVGSFNITQLGLSADKIGKDTNFRGLTVFDNVVYYTKGSGSNGINTVYFIDTTGYDGNGKPLACPNGTGLPGPSATLPTAPIPYDASQLQTKGVVPYNMCILKGLPTTTAKKEKSFFPFGIWFANAKTLYLAIEGDGDNTYDAGAGTYTVAAAQSAAGLQKWVFDDGTGAWKLAYVLSAGLNLGVPYTVNHYPTGNNPATGLPWSPATDGLRNITGRVNRDGTATIWAITSTVSGNGDQGADPNKLVAISDDLAATSLPAGESFQTIRTARFGEVLRGVSFTPGTGAPHHHDRDRHFADRH